MAWSISNPFDGWKFPWQGGGGGGGGYTPIAEPAAPPRQSPWTSPAVAGPIAGSIISGLFGYYQYKKNKKDQRRRDAEQRAWEKEMAQMGLTWRMEDAKRAGIHPLAALGFNGPMPSPVGVGSDNDFYGDFGRNLGQDVSSAISRTQSKEQKIAAALTLEKMGLENELLRTEVMKQRTPAFPALSDNMIPGQGDSSFIGGGPSYGSSSPDRSRPAESSKLTEDVAYTRTDEGIQPYIPQQLSESFENDFLGGLSWQYRNRILPMMTLGMRGKPSRAKLPKGYDDWTIDYGTLGGWRPVKVGKAKWWKGWRPQFGKRRKVWRED